jgi:MFS family permease
MADAPPERSTRAILVGTRPPFWLLMLFATMSPFSLLLFFPALPPLAEELGIGLGSVQWIITGFLIGVGTMQLVIGPLADRLGRRRIVLTGLIFYILTSAVAAARIIALTAAAAMTLLTVFPAALTDLFGKSPDVVGYYTSAYTRSTII